MSRGINSFDRKRVKKLFHIFEAAMQPNLNPVEKPPKPTKNKKYRKETEAERRNRQDTKKIM